MCFSFFVNIMKNLILNSQVIYWPGEIEENCHLRWRKNIFFNYYNLNYNFYCHHSFLVNDKLYLSKIVSHMSCDIQFNRMPCELPHGTQLKKLQIKKKVYEREFTLKVARKSKGLLYEP